MLWNSSKLTFGKPYDFLNELAQFPELTSFTFNMEKSTDRRSEIPIAPTLTPDLCIHLTQYLQSRKRGVGLQTISINEGYDTETLEYRPAFVCRISRNGSISLQELETISPQQEVFRKMHSLTYNSWRQERPFHAEFGPSGEEELIWVAKRLGDGFDWARTELLPHGLITKEQLEGTQRMCFQNLKDAVARDGRYRERLRQMVKDELLWLKRRRDFVQKHGEDCTLFDILYPSVEKQRWEGSGI